MSTLHQRAEIALRDERLQQALNRTMDKFEHGRQQAFAALPHGEQLRDRARSIRAETLAHLDEYLLAVERSAVANGSQVHWARDAAEARQLVLKIARENDVKRIVKSKSMLSEEVEINQVLQRAGLQVVETDLGEYIVQLAGDKPSHIIAPVVHWRLEDIAALFNQHLGTPTNADIPALQAAARQALREDFLKADMGISGANFVVAESGSVVLVTNEGNGRFVTSTPRVHVALVGIERIVPTFGDLATLLQVLARSGTGQALSSYTSIITGPRRHVDEDGPEQVHLILIDNGRSKALAGELAESLYCIRCGACLNVCPIYRTIGGHAYGSLYPGPIGIVVTPALDGLGTWSDLPQASSLCGACTEACPVRIDIPRMLLALRAETVKEEWDPVSVHWGIRLYTWLATRPRWFRLAARGAGIAQRLLPHSVERWTVRLPGPLSAWTHDRAFPPVAKESFTERWMKGKHGQSQ